MVGMAKKPDTRKGDRSADGVSVKSFKVTDEVWGKVVARATADGVPASAVVRHALAQYLGLPADKAEPIGRSDR